MVLATNRAAQAREVAFDHVGVLAVSVAVGDAVIDPLRSELHFQRIPVRGFVGKHGSAGDHAGAGDLDAFGFAMANELQGAATALAQRHHNAAAIGLVAFSRR